MTLQIRQNLATPARLQALAPHAMNNPIGITVHNTANDATACAEVRNVINNNPQTSFHVAVDDNEAVQGIPFDRNTWHASDGANGTGNRQTISVEICFSRSGGPRFIQAEKNAARLCAQLCVERGWTIRDIYTHQHWDPNSQRCPHRTLDSGWQRFLNLVQAEINNINSKVGWIQLGTDWVFYKNGQRQTGWLNNNQSWFFLNDQGIMQTGWQLIKDTWFHFTINGNMQTGWQQINGEWYFLNDQGEMQTGWIFNGQCWFWMNEDGKMVTGEVEIDGAVHRFNSSGSWLGEV